jgi:prepilin-type N-terminal cleavage/methylation domain-containing protein
MSTLRKPLYCKARQGKARHGKAGFTLIELSIVLVIIGLVIGGVTVGQDLIRSAELNSVITDVRKYELAYNTFKLKYDELPGDIDNAQSYWPTCIDNGAANLCNGNGNGKVNGWEAVRSWQHLSLARIIPGNYVGVQDGSPWRDSYPKLLDKIIRTGIEEWIIYDGAVEREKIPLGTYFWQEEGETQLYENIMRYLDDKFDDGNPIRGKILLINQSDEGRTGCLNLTKTDYNRNENNLGDFNSCISAFKVEY